MKVLVTGSAGRVGRSVYIHLMKTHDVIGVDTTPCSTTDWVGDIRDERFINDHLKGVDVIAHTAALHAPHVNLREDRDFQRINVDATTMLARCGIKHGIKHFVFTSTTALYGFASTPNNTAGWINEQVTPKPKTIYHRSKIEAENKLHGISNQCGLPITVLQMSRCFPEPADSMAVYRLTRGIDARDVANAHAKAIEKRLSGFRRFIVSGKTPFNPSETQRLYHEADQLLREKCPQLAHEFERREWALPTRLDRVYDSSMAQHSLGWQPKHGFISVFEMLDQEIAEVLPVIRSPILL